MKITIVSTSHHRNGISGEPFDITLFKDGETTMLAFDFGDGGFGCVDVNKAAAGDIAFGSNSFRGDHYQDEVRRLASKHDDAVSPGALFVRYKAK